MTRRARFRFVDFAAAAQPGFRNHVVTVDEVAGLITQYGAAECYASIFCFSDDVLLHLAEHRVGGRPSIAGYDGKVWAPFLPLDLDAGPAELQTALDLARRTYRVLLEHWQLPAAALHVYFSGAKGFHLLIDTRVFGRVAAARNLPAAFSRLRLEILRALPDAARPFFDLSIGDKVRLLRLPNTRHRGSGLYKVPVDPGELDCATVEDIRRLAHSPRPLRHVRAAGLLPAEAVGAAPAAVVVFERARHAMRRARGPHPYRMVPPPTAPEEALCAARRVMWLSQIPPGNRNNVAIRLASAFRLGGYTRAQTRALLFAWNERCRINLPERELSAVIQSAYSRPYPYAYGCHDEVIRAFCPYTDRLTECDDYREQHPRSGRSL
jgi:hypothetical protein